MPNVSAAKTYGLWAGPVNRKIISELEQNGQNLLILPSMMTEKIEIKENIVSRALDESDWLILTDVWAAGFLIETLRQLGRDLFEMDNFRICAYGEAVADRLRFVQIHSDVIPVRLDDESVFEEIAGYSGEGLRGRRFLLVKEISRPAGIRSKLQTAGAFVEEIPLYRTTFDNAGEILKYKTLLKGGAVDELIISSPEDVYNLSYLFSETEMTELLKDIKLSATNETAFRNLQERCLRPLYYQPQ